MKTYRVAIDGPAAAGKTTLAKMIAEEKGIIYIDIGAMYRATGLYCLWNRIEISDHDAVKNALENIKIELKHTKNGQALLLNGANVNGLIRAENISMAASGVSAIPAVREYLVDMQQKIAKDISVVMEGRDIGTVVLPDAEIKFYLDAAPAERAKRRYFDLVNKQENINLDEIEKDLRIRDYNDMHREISPLRQAEDALYIDSTNISIDTVKNFMLSVINKYKQVYC